jgi:serine protease SohB
MLHEKYKHFGKILKSATLTKEERKAEKKKDKKEDKVKKHEHQRKIFVIDFDGDMKASATEDLRQEVTAILNAATPQDEVVIRLESPGGVVHGYGLAASQLLRIREKNIPLTVCVDKVAASGGYLMSCVANKILSAPFAIVGSIGVVAQLPNFYQVLKKHNVDFKEYTAGEYWYGKQALGLKLVDEIQTSDDYLLSQAGTNQIIKVSFAKKQKLSEKLAEIVGKASQGAALKIYENLERKKFLYEIQCIAVKMH